MVALMTEIAPHMSTESFCSISESQDIIPNTFLYTTKQVMNFSSMTERRMPFASTAHFLSESFEM